MPSADASCRARASSGPSPLTTRRAGLIYVHILNWEDERLFVPIESRIKRASNLSGGTVPMKTVSGGIELTVPKAEAGVWDRIIVLQQ